MPRRALPAAEYRDRIEKQVATGGALDGGGKLLPKQPSKPKDSEELLTGISKPFAGFDNFDACVASMKQQGHSDESARRICGALMSEYEKAVAAEPEKGDAKVEEKPRKKSLEDFKHELEPDLDFVRELTEVSKFLSGERVLEIGCGSGRAMKILSKSGFALEGVDPSEWAVQHVLKSGMNAMHYDAVELPFGDRMYDTAFSMHVLDKLGGDVAKAISESARVSKRAVHLVSIVKGDGSGEFDSFDSFKTFVEGIPGIDAYDVQYHQVAGGVVLQLDAKPEQSVEVKKSIWVPIAKLDEERRIVTGIVLQPDVVDAQGDIISSEVIENAAYNFLSNFSPTAAVVSKLGYQHREFGKRLALVESYIAPSPFMLGGKMVRKGSWVMSVKVLDDAVWSEVKAGKVRGFSIGGFAKARRLEN